MSNGRCTQRTCEWCRQPFEALLTEVRQGYARLCSIQCRSAWNGRRTSAERFWSKVVKTESCWLWTGGVTVGYGAMWLSPDQRGKNGLPQTKFILAHRFSWIIHNGAIPGELCVLHNCPDGDNPRCVNPAHLFLGTRPENLKDAKAKGRTSRGEDHYQAKLTTADVQSIRARYAAGELQKHLAEEFHVCRSYISTLVNKKCWQHITD